jgi:Spy/CpxP family protein refolding chaperone
MKTCFTFFLFCFALAVNAQRYDNGQTINGRSRALAAQMTPPKSKPQPDTKEQIEMVVQKFTDDLKLDSFQAAVIKQLFASNVAEQERILAEEIPDESKVEKIIASREKMNVKVKEILTPEQTAKFEAMGKKKK